MKEWKNAEVLELSVSETAQGGVYSEKVDGHWIDTAEDGHKQLYETYDPNALS